MANHPLDSELNDLWRRRAQGLSQDEWRRLHEIIESEAPKHGKAKSILRNLPDSEQNYVALYFDQKVWRPVGDPEYRQRHPQAAKPYITVRALRLFFVNYLLDRIDEPGPEVGFDSEDTLSDWLITQFRAEELRADDSDQFGNGALIDEALAAKVRGSAEQFLGDRTNFEVAIIARVFSGDSNLNAVATEFGVAPASAKYRAEQLGVKLKKTKEEFAELEQWNGSLIADWVLQAIRLVDPGRTPALAVECGAAIVTVLKILMDCALYQDKARNRRAD